MLGPTKKDRLINVGRDPRNGKPLYKLSYQLDRELARDSYVQFPANGPSSSLMSSGGDCLVRINRASAAWIKHVYINVQFTVATAAVTLLPMPWWFANGSGLNFYKSTDTTPFQQLFLEALIVHLNTFNSKKIDSTAYKILCKPDLYNTLPL